MKSCPKCQKKRLESTILLGVTLDQCPNCKGLWFDDLQEFHDAKDKQDEMLCWLELDIEKLPLKDSLYACPVCEDILLHAVEFGDTHIECCSTCTGVWLDFHDFRTILRSLEKEALEKSPETYCQALFEEAYEVISGPKGFVSECQDFSQLAILLQYRLGSLLPAVVVRITSKLAAAAVHTHPGNMLEEASGIAIELDLLN